MTNATTKRSKPTMVKLVALFKHPGAENLTAFEDHYLNTHLPLIRQVPGMVRFAATKLTSLRPGQEAPYYRMAEMYFADKGSFDTGMASAENRAAGKDLMSFARDYVTMLYAEEEA